MLQFAKEKFPSAFKWGPSKAHLSSITAITETSGLTAEASDFTFTEAKSYILKYKESGSDPEDPSSGEK